MASLDSLLRAVVEHGMDSLVLEPGHLPRLRRKGQERSVTKTRLDGELIRRLGEEVADRPVPDPGSNPAGEVPWEFVYRLDGTPFHFKGQPGPRGWTLEARPSLPPESSPIDLPETRPSGIPHPGSAVRFPQAGPAVSSGARGRRLSSLDDLLTEIVSKGASDLHLSPGQPVRARIDGDLKPLDLETPDPDRLRELIATIVPPDRREEYLGSCDADFGYEITGVARFRVNLFRDRLGMGAVMRQIPETIPSADDLGLPPAVRELAALPKGLVLVTGPTGSGKSTTLAALLDLVNRTRDDHIISIEDPIEFVHPSKRCMVNQREVGAHTDSFARALRAALREDPDVVLVGEMRDLETTSIAIETAETGHLVFGTLHTTSAISTIERLINQFPADRQEQVRLMLADSLKAVISQNLLKRIGGGRVAAQEILICNRAVGNLIRENKAYQITSIMQTGKARGNVVLNEALLALVKSKTVEAREAYLKAVDKEDLLNRLRTEGIKVELGEAADETPREESAA